MSFYGMIVGVVIAGVGVVLEGISAAITGIQSTKVEDPTLKRTLLAASATVGIGTIFFIISLFLFFGYQVISKRLPKKGRGLAIGAIVMSSIALALFITGATIAGVQSNKFREDPVVYNALRTAAILVAIGILLIIIGYTILYILLGKKLRR
jgi:cytochrome bd-type quinol oxidase subunit 1